MSDLKRKPIPRLHEVVQEKLLARILSGELLPGDQLLPERELAAELGVSRPSVRQALSSLASTGFVQITPRGTFVSLTEIGALLRPVVAIMVRQRGALAEFIEFRKILEAGGARLAALRARPEDVAQIDQSIRRMEEAVAAGHNPLDADLQFHLAVARASHNLFVNQMMTLLTNVAEHEAYAPILNAVYRPPGELATWVERSRRVAAAIRSHDADGAAAAMTAYLNRVETLVDQHFETNPQGMREGGGVC